MKKRVLSLLVAFTMIISLLPVTAFAVEDEETTVNLSEGSCTIETAGTYTVSAYTGANTLTVRANATITLEGVNITAPADTSAISIERGDVTLVIAADSAVTGGDNGAGIYVAEEASVTIRGEGKLTAVGNAAADDDSGAAGIGGTWANGNSGAITIDGASVVARGYGNHGSGIGSGSGKVIGEIQIIHGADVTAYGGHCDYADEGVSQEDMWAKKDPEGGAAIGGGGKTASTIADITICDAKVTACGGPKAAGIGANFWSNCGTITICDSAIKAYGGSSSAGIGTSRVNRASGKAYGSGNEGTIVISDSLVEAVGGDFGAGIGSGYNADSCTENISKISVKIENSEVDATGGKASAGIGGGYKNGSVAVEISGGQITAEAGAPLAEEFIYPGQEEYTTWYDRTACAIGSGAHGDHGAITFETDVSEVTVSADTKLAVTAYERGKPAVEGAANDTFEDAYTEIRAPRAGTITPVYTSANGFWGEGGGNASESLVVELYEGENKIASASLNNVVNEDYPEGIIDGDVYVTWSIPFAGSAGEYWTVAWAEGYPRYDMTPTKGVMIIDGTSVAECAVQFNAPDDLNKIVALAEGLTGGIQAYTSLTDAIGNFNGRQVNVLRDVTESIKTLNGCTLTTSVEGGVTITSTYDDWIYCNDLNIGNGVTVVGDSVFYETDGVNTIEGTLVVGEGEDGTYYHGYDARTTVQNGGKVIVNGSTILRYNHSADAGLYIYGDGKDETVEFDCAYYIGAYSGTFYAKDATIETGYFLLKNSYDNSNYADIDMTLDDSVLTVVGTSDLQDSFIIDDQASLTLENSSSIKDVRDFNILEGANLMLDIHASSSVYAANVNIAEDVPLTATRNDDGSVDFELKLSGGGTEADPLLINNLPELLWLQEKVDEQASDGSTQFAGKYFKLTADIDLAGINWNPIGSMTGDHGSFKGVFDGGGHTISNLNCQQPGNGLGLFARTADNAEIRNLTLKNVTVKSTDNSNYVGAVVGNSFASTKISNVHVTGNIDISGRGYIGGISGHGYVVMDHVSVQGEGTISSTFWCAGGILGYGGEGVTHIFNALVEGTGNGLTIRSAAGGLGSIIGMAEDNNGTQPISGENLSAKNILLQTYVGSYGTSFGEYALGYLYGGNETSELTGINKIDNVIFDLSTGNPYPAVSDLAAQLEDMTVYKMLTEALEKADNGETVKLLSNIELTAPITVQKSVVIDGNHKVITQSGDCSNNIALLYFEGTNGADLDVTVKNATFDGIREGAAVRTLYADMTINNVVFQNCEHTTAGQGLVRLTYGSAEITNSKFRNNICPMGISFNWDGDGNADDTLTITECVFDGNTANKTALIYYVKGAGCTITKSEFLNNKVNCADNGAVIYLGFQDNCTVTGNLFKENVVTEANTSIRVAGAIFAGYQAAVTDNAFDGNTASNANGDTLGQVCVSVYYEDGEIDLSSNFWGGEAPAYGKDYTVLHQTGTGSYRFADHYTAYSLDSNGNVVLSGKIAGADAVAEIDGEYYTSLEEAVATVKDGETIELLQDVELSARLDVQKAISFTLDGNGNTFRGALRFNGTDCALKDIVFENCIRGTYAAVEFVNSESSISDCVFQNNNVDVVAVDCDVPKGTGTSRVSITGCIFRNNISHSASIINYADGSSCEIASCDFVDNTGAYAVVYISDDASVTGCYFSGNTLSGSNANQAAILAGPYDEMNQTTYYEVIVNGNAFLDTVFPGVWMEDWTEDYGAVSTYDISNNYWTGGNRPVRDMDYGVTGGPAVTYNSYADKYTRNEGKPGVTVGTYSAPIHAPSASAYKVHISDSVNGTVKVNATYAAKDQTVTITVGPDRGYELETLRVLDKNGNDIRLNARGNGQYTFKMPASKVTIEATFMEDNTMLNYFVDVFAGDYYYEAVQWAVENQVTAGTSYRTFSPNAVCTRAQVVTFLWRAAGCPAPTNTVMPFADVSHDAYYRDAVLWALENGITEGTDADTFSPDAQCTRAQIVTFLWRAQEAEKVTANNPFTDVAQDDYYTDAVLWAVAEAITNGTSATTFAPHETCTRAEVVTFLYRCLAE